jgi:hypothetical protein
MTELKEGDFVEWSSGRDVFHVISVSGNMVQIGHKRGETERVYSVTKEKVHVIEKDQAEKILLIIEVMAAEDKSSKERLASLRRQWNDLWEMVYAARENSQ